jgi:predicted  nucleic acid-binding Zn-ribbon protein
MSQPFKLFRLQQIDSHIDQVRNRLREIETALNDKATLNEARQSYTEAEANLAAAQKALHRAEENVKAQHVKIEQTEAALYGGKVRNPKELQDLQNESASLKRYLATLEDRQLEALIAVEDLEAISKEKAISLSKITAESQALDQHLTKEQASLVQDLKHLENERQAAASSIPADDLGLYERLRQQRRGVAVAKVNVNTCSACGSLVSPALLQAARSPSQLTRCDSCGRILYSG